jgi:hypothetical protein
MAAGIPGGHEKTLGAEKSDDTRVVVADPRRIVVTPQMAQSSSRPGGSGIDGRTPARHGSTKTFNALRDVVETRPNTARPALRREQHGRSGGLLQRPQGRVQGASGRLLMILVSAKATND